jgi:polar amino acid transport system substrate-binding protein
VYDACKVGMAIRSRALALIFVAALAAVGLALWRAHERGDAGAFAPAANRRSPAASLAAGARLPSGTLPIAVEDDAGLWSGPDGTGYANDVVRAAFAAVGQPITLEVVPYARCKQMLLEAVVVACFSMSRNEERAESVAFSAQPLFTCSSELLQRTADPRDFSDEAHLPRGAVVGTVIGYEYPEALDRLERAHAIRLEPSASEDLNLNKLAQGRLDAAVVNVNRTKNLRYMAAHAGVSGRVRRAFTLGELTAYVGFSPKHPRGDEARARFDQGMELITSDGTRERIEHEWAGRAEGLARVLSRPGPAGANPEGGGRP